MPSTPYYESERAVAEYLLFHYGDDSIACPWPFGPLGALHFPSRCVTEGLVAERLPRQARALDVGCAVGRSTFELSKVCAEVVGIDASLRFIEAAAHLKSFAQLPFRIVEQGSVERTATARVPADARADRVEFFHGDALRLDPALGQFDVILAANLIDRVPSPARLLEHLASRVRPAGQLILTSPYTWLEDYAPPSEWLVANGKTTIELIASHLPGFALQRRADLPFLLREHSRKYQWSVAELSVWVRDGA